MIAFDTNLIVRFLTNDDKKQAKIVALLLENNPVFISKSVLLETEWVLRACYEISFRQIAIAFEKFLGLPNISLEDPITTSKVIDLYSKGMDFGDALHVLSCKNEIPFFSFDRKFINKAHKLGLKHVTIPA